MTAVGKILVFLNLVFSLVVGAFVIMIYLARVHWVESDKAKDNQIAVLSANADAYKKDAEKAKQDGDALVAKAQAEMKNVQGDLQAAVTANTDLRDRLSKLEKKSTSENALTSASGSEVQRRQEEVVKLRETLRKETELNNTLVKQNAEFRDEATIAKIDRRSVQEQNERLVARLTQMGRDMARQRSNGGGGTTTARAGNTKNPPAESVEGLVRQTDPKGGLMTLTIGSDAGLTKGHTLELFRLNPSAPTQSKYLGTVRILEAGAHEAVAQPVGRLASPPQVGDRVASRILGS